MRKTRLLQDNSLARPNLCLRFFAPKALYDAGFGVDRRLQLLSDYAQESDYVSLRTSVRNAISYLPIPEEAKTYTGVMTYYLNWQLQLRDVKDIQ